MVGCRLTKIIITEKESDNYYHFFDNRILPPQVDKEIADKDGWWYKPEYLFNELNINSAIASPAHGEEKEEKVPYRADEHDTLAKSPYHRQKSPYHRQKSPYHRQKSPYHRQKSPYHRQKSPYHRQKSPYHRQKSPYHRQKSHPSPKKRRISRPWCAKKRPSSPTEEP